jgi:hypothetical protein
MMFRRMLLALSLLFLSSCASISSMHTAKTTPKGEFDHTLGLGSITADVDAVSGVELDSSDTSSSSVTAPMLEYMFRYGFTESFDMGLRTTGFNHGLDAKYNFYDDATFLISGGMGLTYLSYSISNGISDTSVTAIDIIPAVYMDWVLAENFRLYTVPKMVSRRVSSSGSPDANINYFGASFGLRWGNTLGVFLEYTLLAGSYTPSGSSTEQDVDLSQLAFGFFF